MSPLVWLVTGCSSGLGEEIVHQAIARGDKVIATARRPESIQGMDKYTAGEDPAATILKLDVTDELAVQEQVVAQAIAVYGRIDILVNNAGYVCQGGIEDLRYDDMMNISQKSMNRPAQLEELPWGDTYLQFYTITVTSRFKHSSILMSLVH